MEMLQDIMEVVEVMLMVDGCVDSTCDEIVVDYAESIYAPNAFSPNADGINDFFKVYSTGILEMDVSIYNRW